MSLQGAERIASQTKDLWLRKIIEELKASAESIDSSASSHPDPKKLRTVYFGGGTPSLLEPEAIAAILDTVKSLWPHRFEEITLEANPETVTTEKARSWKDAGITRLSLGVQTFKPELLRRLERLATADDLARACDIAKEIFSHWSLDLMIGIPDGNAEDLESDLSRVANYDPPHLSIYLLTLTKDHIWYRSPTMKTKLPADDAAAQFYVRVCEWARSRGYHHYEISNFAKPGFESVHNANYWNTSSSYLAVGPGAHGYLQSIEGDRMRTIVESDLKAWLAGKEAQIEILSEEQKRLEEAYMNLRLNRGISVNMNVNRAAKVAALESEGLIEIREQRIFLTESGWLCMESLAEALIL